MPKRGRPRKPDAVAEVEGAGAAAVDPEAQLLADELGSVGLRGAIPLLTKCRITSVSALGIYTPSELQATICPERNILEYLSEYQKWSKKRVF